MEYASHIWGGSSHCNILEKVESKAFRIICSPFLTESLQPLQVRRIVASLSLFYRYYNQHCSSELYGRIPPPMRRPRATRLSCSSQRFSVHLSTARLNSYRDSFMYRSCKVWNSLPNSVFPPYFDLNTFKRRFGLCYDHLLTE